MNEQHTGCSDAVVLLVTLLGGDEISISLCGLWRAINWMKKCDLQTQNSEIGIVRAGHHQHLRNPTEICRLDASDLRRTTFFWPVCLKQPSCALTLEDRREQ